MISQKINTIIANKYPYHLLYSTNGSLIIGKSLSVSLPACLRPVYIDSTKIDSSRREDVG